MVGATGFEPATPCAQGRCATGLRYAPASPAPSPVLYRACGGSSIAPGGAAWRLDGALIRAYRLTKPRHKPKRSGGTSWQA